MRRLNLIVLAAALALTSAMETAHGEDLGTAFTYQGQLKEGGVPAEGTYDFLFRLFDAEVNEGGGGTQVGGDVTLDAVAVTAGLFTVQLDFGNTVFGGQARWLEIGVRSAGPGGPYTTLSPRQPLTAAPYAQYALNSASAWEPGGDGINFDGGNVGIGVAEPLLGLHVHQEIGSGARSAYSASVGASLFDPGPGSTKFVYLEPDLDDDRVMWDSSSDLVFAQTDGILFGPGWERMRITGGVSSKVGIGEQFPEAKLHVDNNTSSDTLRLVAPTKGPRVSHAHYGDTGDWYIRSADATGKVILQDSGGNVGIGTSDPGARLDVRTSDATAALSVSGTGGGAASVFNMNNGSGGQAIFATSNSNISPTVSIFNTGTAKALEVFGTASVQVLEITGADLAEKFPVSEPVQPGMVLAIDPDHPGQLCVARGPYNRRVAGIVSGANNLTAGAVLGHLPGSEDAPPVALSGRVWVHCDATRGAIEPGDLLTTADTPGHAMKVMDHWRAQGAIVGKAMSSLPEGTGLVLVLVSLQ